MVGLVAGLADQGVVAALAELQVAAVRATEEAMAAVEATLATAGAG